jgi:hypothetical protein
MDKFELIGNNGFIKIHLAKVLGFPEMTSTFGGYDSESIIEIKSSNYHIIGNLWITTGDIFNFYQELKKCQKMIQGIAHLDSYENNLQMAVCYNELGHVLIKGKFIEKYIENNCLEFELQSDQSFIFSTMIELEDIYKKYGDNKGIKMDNDMM